MSTVVVKWLKSPRQRYGIPRQPGTLSELPSRVAKRIQEEDPDMFVRTDLDEKKEEAPPVVKEVQEEVRTRPVTRKGAQKG